MGDPRRAHFERGEGFTVSLTADGLISSRSKWPHKLLIPLSLFITHLGLFSEALVRQVGEIWGYNGIIMQSSIVMTTG